MSKYSRKIECPERKPSVFERLGGKSSSKLICPHWEENGTCPLGKNCNLARTHLEAMKKDNTKGKQMKESHRRSRSVETPEAPTWDGWEYKDLEGADEKDLQKRRLQLQRALRLQMKREKDSVKKKKKEKRVTRSPSSSSSTTSETTSSTSSSSGSSSHARKRGDRKRKPSLSSGSDDSPHRKKRKMPKSPPKLKMAVKKKAESPRKITNLKKTGRNSPTPSWERRPSPKRKSPLRNKSRVPSPKHKPRDLSPRRLIKPKERRVTPPRATRPRSAERRRHHSPRRRRDGDHGGLEKGGKILPVKSSAYVKEMKESVRRKSADRSRDDRERERDKDKRRREQKLREQAERREREREAERLRRESERQKEREDALERCRERQRERERIDRDKRIKDTELRKPEVKNDLPSLMDIKTEVPREPSRHSWDERRPRREEPFEFRRVTRDGIDAIDDRRGRNIHDYVLEPSSWEEKEDFREPTAGGEWGREWKHRYDQKWSGEGSSGSRERESTWREHYQSRRPADWINEGPPPEEEPIIDHALTEPARRPVEPSASEGIPTIENTAERPTDLEEVLSDISDDADDILNQDDEVVPEIPETTPAQLPAVCISQQGADFFFDHRRPLLECLGDRALDFEEISDEELEEEAKMSKGIMDVLGADWASLMKQTPVKSFVQEGTGTARRRWRVDSIISRIGFSVKLVGKEFADKYLSQIEEDCKEADQIATTQESLDEVVIKAEQTSENEIKKEEGCGNLSEEVSLKKEDDVEMDSIKEEIVEMSLKKRVEQDQFLLAYPGIHSTVKELRGTSMVQRLLHSKYKLALSARTDLAIRRILCGTSPKEPFHLSTCDEKLYETSVNLFKSVAA